MNTKELSKGKNYYPKSMGFLEGYNGPKGDVGFFMVYNEEKAKKIIQSLINVGCAVAGLDGDFEINSQTVYNDGKFSEYDLHDNSIWATPILVVHFENGESETFECWEKQLK